MRNWIIYLCTLISLVFYTYLFGGNIAFVLLYVFLITPVVSLLLTIPAIFMVQAKADIKFSEIERGKPAAICLNIRNSFFLPFPFIDVSFYESEGLTIMNGKVLRLSLGPFSVNNINVSYSANNRGQHQIGIKKMTAYDLTGLFKVTIQSKNSKEGLSKIITVLPKIDPFRYSGKKLFTQSDMPELGENTYSSPSSTGYPGSEVREYRNGDSLNTVHWKLSARMDTWLIRVPEKQASEIKALVLDLYRPAFPARERKVKTWFEHLLGMEEKQENNPWMEMENKIMESLLWTAYQTLYAGNTLEIWYSFQGDWVMASVKNVKELYEFRYELAKLKFFSLEEKGSIYRLPLVGLSHEITGNKSKSGLGNNIRLFTGCFDSALEFELENASKWGANLSIVNFVLERTDNAHTKVPKYANSRRNVKVYNMYPEDNFQNTLNEGWIES
ncbi:MAG: DUF58 domain-containing protein [Clostridia bacterium]|nr:DUF58 domain-containing protein [Clostridia bacterium]